MKSKDWLQRHIKDSYVENARKKGYVSRASFKLLEIEKKFNIISGSKNILELGSSPGGWSQVICLYNKVVSIYAFDILDMKYKNSQIIFFKKNFLNFDFKTINKKFDLVLSDVAPNTIGHKSTDHLRIITLVEEIIEIVKLNIKLNGNFVFKIWKGSQEKIIINYLKAIFKKISYFKPKSSRNESSEIYIIAQNFIGK